MSKVTAANSGWLLTSTLLCCCISHSYTVVLAAGEGQLELDHDDEVRSDRTRDLEHKIKILAVYFANLTIIQKNIAWLKAKFISLKVATLLLRHIHGFIYLQEMRKTRWAAKIQYEFLNRDKVKQCM